MFAQYCRIEAKAGGLHCTTRAFIRAAHTLLTPKGRSRAQRTQRHAWLREHLKIRDEIRQLTHDLSLEGAPPCDP